MAHTPGPWWLRPTHDHGKYILGSSSAGSEHAVAECHSGDDNARLIAAAPDLLAACERAKGFVESWEKQLGDWDEVDQNTINAINAAIAKARGI